MDKPPLSLKTGKVFTANGQTYDMSLPDDKQSMVVENLVYWIDKQRANIQTVDPTALVTASFPAINPSQGQINPTLAIYQSSADFIDLHIYLGWGLSLQQYMSFYEFQDNPLKPVILGEFGISSRAYPSADLAAKELVKWQVETCGYGFDGWLVWTYNVNGQDDLWHGVSDQGQIHEALSPAARPDPCE
jgi:endo-1,4-beta-mannosidase